MKQPFRSFAAIGILAALPGLLAGPGALAQTATTELISKDSFGVQGDGPSFSPVISANGRFVAFHSLATNLTPEGSRGGFNVYLHERDTGLTELISITRTGQVSVSTSTAGPSINADGRFVAFYSRAIDLTPGPDTNGNRTDVFVRDRTEGTTEFVSINSAGVQSNGFSGDPSISNDGRFVAFWSDGTNLVPGGDANGSQMDVFVHDRETGNTELVSVDSAGIQGNGRSWKPMISADGRFVAFESTATNLAPLGDVNGSLSDVFVHDRDTGETHLVSVNGAGEQGNGSSVHPAMSDDGRIVAFHSSSDNLLPGGDANGFFLDVFVHDRQTGETWLAAVNSAGEQANDVSAFPSLSANGRFVAFWTRATNLTEGRDVNGIANDVFIHDRQSGTTTLASVSSAGVQSNGSSNMSDPDSLSADGSAVVFQSWASNLTPGGDPFDPLNNVYLHDRGTANRPPVADAGPDQQVACTGPEGALVMLDGFGSSDPDPGPRNFFWTGPFPEGGGTARGPDPVVTLGLGVSIITLVVNDGELDSEPDTVAITVEDVSAPVVSAALMPIRHDDDDDDDGEGLLQVAFSAEDVCDPVPAVAAVLAVPGLSDIPVTNGQIVEFEVDDETEIEFDDGILEIEAPSLTLRVTGSDASGNSAVAEAGPEGAASVVLAAPAN